MTHGTRTAYTWHRCRCNPCTEANRVYNERRRAPRSNYLIPGSVAQAHLKGLQQSGVGLRSVHDVTGISVSRLFEITTGAARIKRKTQRLILDVTADAHADGARIPSGPTVKMVRQLKREGFNYKQLALRLDMCPEALQRMVKRKGNVLARTQMRLEKFYMRIMAA
jgi:hypothetical protein